ncbi:hypothetical protein MYCTH_2303692 [Thermothelomyces thermophilus ATCC 42464]|uniref:Zn(2)-C6 fungal-type domain-containing protein n=1 Tax=Thermothelomyces thermophilus (strain ATCC 42464 / BCRC 31852 / DSM 1799) TaxID=573729 RepID=G2QDB2_THET4|nr:uncharacterized protein MYCTH_2303692 [Thermothelomyces thermophilus ATCC 42464]AEO57478.1 hypothetical protein MYCTH_2303692 [Thermothelomyces thermophilus ATCC 42464]
MAKANSQKAACDRCRGQKLRCIWDPKEPQCQRCARANAVCTIPPPRPMGRPPRQYRSQSSSSHSRGQTQSLYSWSEENATSTAPVSDEDTDIAMNSANVLSDPLDFLPWFPEPDGLSLSAPRGTFPTPVTAPAPIPNGTPNVNGTRPFGQQNEIFASPLNNGGKPAEGNQSNHSGVDEADQMDYTTVENGGPGDDQIQLLTELCELNVALFQHPLHREKDKAGLRTMLASHSENARPQQPAEAPSADSSSNGSNGSSVIELNARELRTGNLFEMTCRLMDIVTRIRAQEEAAAQGQERYDRSTALIALSCYTRLDVLYSRALDILVRIRNNGPIPEGSHHLMPELVIDGFSMKRCLDLQLNFLIYLHGQARERIRSCIRSAEGTARVGRDRRDSARQGSPAPARFDL